MCSVKTVSAAYARTHLPQLLQEVQKGNSVVISRYKKPLAVLAPAIPAKKPKPKFGTLKGKVKLIDPHALDPMTEDDVDALLDGRY